MPKAAKRQTTPGDVLQSFIDNYQINPFSLSKSLKVNYQTVTHILNGKSRITVQMALRLAQYFGNSPKYWLDVQASSEIDELSADKKFISSIKSIPKAEKPTGKAKKKTNDKTKKNKTLTLAEKRKRAAKIPGAKKARGGKTKKSKK